jgi:hypothetical protein
VQSRSELERYILSPLPAFRLQSYIFRLLLLKGCLAGPYMSVDVLIRIGVCMSYLETKHVSLLPDSFITPWQIFNVIA